MREFAAARIPKPEIIPPALDFQAPHVDLEIGAGQGLHAIRYCAANPGRLLLALEKTHARFAQLEQRLKHHPGHSNLRIFHTDAVAFVTHFVPPLSLDRVFLLYPCPYPKAKQANLRWHNRPFMRHLLEKVKAQGELTVATNVEWYAEEARKAFTERWQLELLEASHVDPTAPARTHFEKKYLARLETCWNLRFRKK